MLELPHLVNVDSLKAYADWPSPTTIISDGAYGLSSFEGDTDTPQELPEWYAAHIEAWTRAATARTTLWIWNTEVGWATLHPELAARGWQYVGLNVWDKGKSHMAGKVNSLTIRRFPAVTEVCAHYVRTEQTVARWLIGEWQRAKLTKYEANRACGVKNAASRKYLTAGKLWYLPPPEILLRLINYANQHGEESGRPYFLRNGQVPTLAELQHERPVFHCPHGVSNVWAEPPLRNHERVKLAGLQSALHPNQKPLKLMQRLIVASSNVGDVIWEPFGGLFTASLAAALSDRIAYGAEHHPRLYDIGANRIMMALNKNAKQQPGIK